MLRCARRTNNYRKISKVVNRRSVTNLLVPEVVTMTESTAAVAVVMAVVADEAEVVVVALEEEVVADGDDDSIELQKETTRRRCITAWSVFFWRNTQYEAWQRGAGMAVCLFYTYSPALLLKGRNAETTRNHETREFGYRPLIESWITC
jgi:hypothetical protein